MLDRAVIFDLFGTLVDSFSLQEHRRVLSEMAASLGVAPDDFSRLWFETYKERGTGIFPTVEANLDHICRALGHALDPDRIAAATRLRVDFTRRSLRPRPDAIRTLAQLKAWGKKIGLISDCSPDVPLLWKDTPFHPWIESPLFSCSVGYFKPDPRIYGMVCERLAVRPQECLYVGDGGSHELTGALEAGMHAVLIRVPYEDTNDVHRPGADVWQGPVVPTLSEVLMMTV